MTHVRASISSEPYYGQPYGLSRKKGTYRQSLLRVDFYHASEQILALGWHEMWYVK